MAVLMALVVAALVLSAMIPSIHSFKSRFFVQHQQTAFVQHQQTAKTIINVNNNDRNTNAVRKSAPLFDRINGGYNRGGYRGGGGRGGGYRGGGGRGRSRYVHY